ncbi:MAG TPA: hypothetical protein V6D48_02750 [Oculatellaceae cyanobacterium]
MQLVQVVVPRRHECDYERTGQGWLKRSHFHLSHSYDHLTRLEPSGVYHWVVLELTQDVCR